MGFGVGRDFPMVRRVLLLLPLLLAVLLIACASPEARGMGQSPTTCPNSYSGQLISLLLTYPGGTLNPIAHPNSNLSLPTDQTYSVAFTIQTGSLSSDGNKENGTVWYSQNLYGYDDGICTRASGPGALVNVTIYNIAAPATYTPGVGTYSYQWYTWYQGKQGDIVTYNVNWTNPTHNVSPPPSTTTSSSSVSSAIESTSMPTFTITSSSSSTSSLSTVPEFPQQNSLVAVTIFALAIVGAMVGRLPRRTIR